MYENAFLKRLLQTTLEDEREQEPYSSRTFVGLNVLGYKRAR